MKLQITALLLLGVALSIPPIGQSHLSSRALATTQFSPSFYFNDPSPIPASNGTAGFDLNPGALVTAGDGNLWIAWESNTGGTYQIYYQTYNGIVWTNPQVVSTSGFNSAPSLAQLINGTVVLVWAAGTSGSDDHLYYRTYTNGVWQSIFSLTSGTGFTDEFPKAVVTRDSTLWVFFERDTSTGPSTPPNRQVYYKTLTGNQWSADTIFTTDSASNQQPAATIIKNGNIWVAWARNTTVGGNVTIYDRSFNGTTWSTDVALTSPAPASSPNLVQDRNGTIWLLWSQNMHLSTTITQNQVLYESSVDVGQTWTPATNLTQWGDVNNPINNLTPFGVQGSDTSLYMFFATDVVQPTGNGFHIFYIRSSPIHPVYDVGIAGTQVSPVMTYPYGYHATAADHCITTITVTVTNYGDADEPVTVSLQASNTTYYPPFSLGSVRGLIRAGLTKVFTFTWNVTGIHAGRYALLASIPPVTGQTQGNALHDALTLKSGVIVLFAGDVKRLGFVGLGDIIVIQQAYGSTVGSPKWLPDGDLNRNGKIDAGDIIVALHNYNKRI